MQPEKRGPGRPRREQAEERTERRRRNLQSTGGRLGVDPALLDHSKYAYRWINDEPGRLVTKTKHDDWDMVPNSGEKEDNTDLGAMVSIVVGTMPDGSPKRAFLCRKLRKFYEEDHAAAQAELDAQIAQLRRGNDRNGAAQSDYVPLGAISIA